MAQLREITQLEPARRVEDAWERLRDLRRQRWEIEQQIVAAEAELDLERKRESFGMTGLLTLAEAAKRVHLHESTLSKDIRAGRLTPTRMGRKVLISEDELTRYVESGGGRTA